MGVRGRDLLAVLALGGLVGCGSATGGDPVPLDGLVGEVLAAECDVSVRCHYVSDNALCTAVYGPLFAGQLFNDFGAAIVAAKAGKAHYDGAIARSCLNALRAIACQDTTPGPDECNQVFTGTLADGARCTVDVACLPGSFCASPTNASAPCDGTCTHGGTLCNDDSQCTGGMICDTSITTSTSSGGCVTPVAPGAAGQPCGTRDRCARGLFCSATGTCMTPAQAGESCASARSQFPCAVGLTCVGAGTARTCQPLAAKGEACMGSEQCGGFLSSLGCDPTSHVCVDLPSSGPCLGTGALSCNPLTSFCDGTMATPTCQLFAPSGAACAISNISQCGSLFTPSGPTCESPGGTGTGTCTPSPDVVACVP